MRRQKRAALSTARFSFSEIAIAGLSGRRSVGVRRLRELRLELVAVRLELLAGGLQRAAARGILMAEAAGLAGRLSEGRRCAGRSRRRHEYQTGNQAGRRSAAHEC
jgi:hypothetical protein